MNTSGLAGLAAGGQPAGFGHDVWWIVLIKVVAAFVLLLLLTLFAVVFERKVIGAFQVRPGPNRKARGFGWLQSLADGLKLAFKEEIIPTLADKPVYFIAPVISGAVAFLSFAVIPLGPEVSIFGHHTMLQVSDVPVAVLVILAASSMAVYGTVLAGWASGTSWPLLGGMRAAAQMISYEVAMGLSMVAVFMTAHSMSTSEIVAAQAHGASLELGVFTTHIPSWYFIPLLPSFVIYFISALGEGNRTPFDLPEGESELTGGYLTEYSSFKFAMFYLAEYIAMVTISALCVTLFFGGWRAPWPISLWSGANSGWVPIIWFLAKTIIFMGVLVWIRATLPRVRYDQLMKLGWKVLMPVNLVWILILAGLRVAARNNDQTKYLVLAGIVVTVLLLVLVWPEKQKDDRTQLKREIDTGVGGYPVPPLDLVVPPNPRLKRLEAERAEEPVGAGSKGSAGSGAAAGGPSETAASGGSEE
ncbi:NADH-quinone oxidoreductase subunit NuoH [Actinocatenispora rupis]|uniref:NADH-quinone oxidoreductase subunit H n=1 Tax=Actinocatenispora rupis TaxID=519421 RepID=A0A8J3NFS9_9ACTN|nr:NADH-quinone oxidoreductase subunit NuoH [Actinocatenispora rupis]GID15652.1 NADH-quinone oxidoreductase subunit H [Actinocatenispora rupis]